MLRPVVLALWLVPITGCGVHHGRSTMGSQVIGLCDPVKSGSDVAVFTSDTEGGVLPGVVVWLVTQSEELPSLTGPDGYALFSGVVTGRRYQVKAALTGFKPVGPRDLTLRNGCRTEIRIKMSVDLSQTDGPLLVEPVKQRPKR
jgi:hypothetical protein